MSAPQPMTVAEIRGYTPSHYQQAIFNTIQAIVENKSDVTYIVVEAVAGSGKTFVITRAAYDYIPRDQSILFCTFIKELSKDISKKVLPNPETGEGGLQNATVLNVHKVGMKALSDHFGSSPRVDKYSGKMKHYRLSERYISEKHPDLISYRKPNSDRIYLSDEGRIVKDAICDLYVKTRLTMTDPNDRAALITLARHFEIDFDDRSIDAIPQIMQWGEQEAIEQRLIDFEDMLYLPVKWGLPLPQYDWVMVDEAQDLSRVQLELSMMCRKETGHMVFVGDRNQAIMGFAGADNRSLENIIERTQATTLPLSICYRCPTTVIDKAREVIPHIEAKEGAAVGEITVIPEDKLPQYAKPGDMIICRLTAPLISQCIEFIKQGRAAKVKGRDIGKQLTAIVDKVSKRDNFTFELFLEHLFHYQRQQVGMMRDKEMDDTAIESFEDRCAAVVACFENYHEQVDNTKDFNAKINALFDDNQVPIQLATIHKSKGLEADNVFILAPHKLPLQTGGWQMKQEWNLLYVAVTRAKKHLYAVGGPLTPGPYAAGKPQPGQLALDPPHHALMEAAEAAHDALTDAPYRCRTCGERFPTDMLTDHICALCLEDPEIREDAEARKLELVEKNDAPNPDITALVDHVEKNLRDIAKKHHGNDPEFVPPGFEKIDAQLDAEEEAEFQRQVAEVQTDIEESRRTNRALENAESQKTAPGAQKGPQERRGPESDINPAGRVGGIKTPAMVRQRSLFEPVEEKQPPDREDNHMLTDDDAQTLEILNSFQFDFAKDLLSEIEAKISTIDNPESKQNALEALETLRDIFG